MFYNHEIIFPVIPNYQSCTKKKFVIIKLKLQPREFLNALLWISKILKNQLFWVFKAPKFLQKQNLSQFLKVSLKIALQPKLSENASWQIGSGSRKLWEIWPWFFYQLIDLVGGGVESAHGFFIRRLDFSVDHLEVDTLRKIWLFKIPLHFL